MVGQHPRQSGEHWVHARETVLAWLRNLLAYNKLENHSRFLSGDAQRASVVRVRYCSALETVLFGGH
jgi:hypothetical protein